MTVEICKPWSLCSFWSASLWLDREEIAFLFPILQHLHRSGKVAIFCILSNHFLNRSLKRAEEALRVYHIVRSMSLDISLLDKVIFLDEQYLFLRHHFPFWCCRIILLNFSSCFFCDISRNIQSTFSITSIFKINYQWTTRLCWFSSR